jgi:hypothetical protein
MIFKDILRKCVSLSVFEKRKVSPKYIEFVIFRKDLASWNSALSEFLGDPAKPAGSEPSEQDFALTKPYGGIRENQILFKKKTTEGCIIVMLWPWQDGLHITIKMADIKKA